MFSMSYRILGSHGISWGLVGSPGASLGYPRGLPGASLGLPRASLGSPFSPAPSQSSSSASSYFRGPSSTIPLIDVSSKVGTPWICSVVTE